MKVDVSVEVGESVEVGLAVGDSVELGVVVAVGVAVKLAVGMDVGLRVGLTVGLSGGTVEGVGEGRGVKVFVAGAGFKGGSFLLQLIIPAAASPKAIKARILVFPFRDMAQDYIIFCSSSGVSRQGVVSQFE